MATRLKQLQREPLKSVSVKVSKEDLEILQTKADEFVDGNISAWLRYAATRYVPRKEEIVNDKK